MSEAQQYEQDQCASAKSDSDKELMQIAMAEKAAKRREHERDVMIEQQRESKK